MLPEPDCGLVGLLGEVREPVLDVLGSEVVDPELRLERRHQELVHLDVLPVELDPGNAVLDVGLVAEGVGPEVEHLHVAVVVPRADHPLLVGERVPESYRPTVPSALPKNICGSLRSSPPVPYSGSAWTWMVSFCCCWLSPTRPGCLGIR